MRDPIRTLGLLLALTAPASAQVSVDLHALDALPNAAPDAPATPAGPASKKPAAKSRHTARAAKKPAPVPAAPTATVTAPPPSPLALPKAAPPVATLAPVPPPPAPAHPPAPPPPPPVAADAGGSVAPIPSGLRLIFEPNHADFTQDTEQQLVGLAKSVPPAEGRSFSVLAYASGSPDDPSTPRRVSLSRALAARSVLMAQGVPSTRIYVRALGASVPDGPPDRVDVVVGAPAIAAPPKAPPAPATPAAPSPPP